MIDIITLFSLFSLIERGILWKCRGEPIQGGSWWSSQHRIFEEIGQKSSQNMIFEEFLWDEITLSTFYASYKRGNYSKLALILKQQN